MDYLESQLFYLNFLFNSLKVLFLSIIPELCLQSADLLNANMSRNKQLQDKLKEQYQLVVAEGEGVYQYVLVVDGKVVDRKQMVQAK